VFDLGDMPRQNNAPRDGVACLNVSTIALKIRFIFYKKMVKQNCRPTIYFDPDFVIGVWASASRQQIRTLTPNGAESFAGDWIQVSRLGMPLTNEAVIPLGSKDLWNSMSAYDDLAALGTFGNYFYNPELALYMDDSQFGGAVPAFSNLRIQSNSLGAFDFRKWTHGIVSIERNFCCNGYCIG
jgi:hypothetical protein